MIDKININKLLLKMTDDENSNLRNIKKTFGSLDYTDDDNQSILHILADNRYDEKKCFIAIKSLLNLGFNPNLVDDFNYNFIQTALYAGYSEKFILNIIKEALKHGLDVNHVDMDKDTIMHTAIYSDDYHGGVERIYELLSENGFDSSLSDQDKRNLLDAMIYQRQYNKREIESFKKKFEKNKQYIYLDDEAYQCEHKQQESDQDDKLKPDLANKKLSNCELQELEQYGTILNEKKYMVSPAIGREREIKSLMITLAQDKKRPLIVGESGVGKTALVDELAFEIKSGKVPTFLQNRIILEVNPSELVAGCKYVGMFEQNMTNLIKLCDKYNVILFIDEIHTIYGVGSTENKANDMANILKHYIDRTDLKVIGTTTDREYDEFFSSDALKRRFEKINVKEPDKGTLYKIINKVIEDYYVKTGITLENENIRDQIVNIILNFTLKNNRVYNDRVNNPDLSISIIDKAFALAKVYDGEFITAEHFAESFEYCDRLYETSRKEAISELRRIDDSISKTPRRILKFSKYRK